MLKLVFVLLIAISCSDDIKIVEKYSLPIKEISGICFKGDILHLVSDRDDIIYTLDWEKRKTNLKLGKIDLKSITGKDYGGQWESIYCHADGRLSLLQEDTSLLLTLNSIRTKVESSILLKTESDIKFHKAWVKDDNSKGEGLVFLPNQKLLVIKEKKPVELVLFDKDKTIEQSWSINPAKKKRVKDISEIAFNGSKLFFVSDKSNVIGEISSFAGSDEYFKMVNIKDLPSELEKVEGLAFHHSGQTVIAIDSKSTTDNNVFIIE